MTIAHVKAARAKVAKIDPSILDIMRDDGVIMKLSAAMKPGEPVPTGEEMRRALDHSPDDDKWGTRMLGRDLDRSAFIKTFGFSIPSYEAVETLNALGPLVEVAAGTGYWTTLLNTHGGDCIATDIGERGADNGFGQKVGNWQLDLTISGEDAVNRYPDRSVFASWLYMDEPWQVEMLRRIRPGRFFAMIGEGKGGCTSTDRVFDLLDSDQFEPVLGVYLPQFYGLHDNLGIWRKTDGRLKRAKLDPARLP